MVFGQFRDTNFSFLFHLALAGDFVLVRNKEEEEEGKNQ